MILPLEDTLTSSVIGFMGGIVATIVKPTRRGAAGFFQSATVGVFCGTISAVTIAGFGFHRGAQYLSAALGGLFGDRVMTAISKFGEAAKSITNNFHIDGDQNQILQGPGMDVDIRSNRRRAKRRPVVDGTPSADNSDSEDEDEDNP